MKKFTKLITLMLVLCMIATLMLACNSTEEPTEAPTNAPTETPTSTPTSKPTTKPTSKPTEKLPENIESVDFYELLDYNGEDFDEEMIDVGQGSYMYVVKDTTPDAYEDFKEQLADAGCYLYTTYEEDEHSYATFVTKFQIIHTMLLKYDYDENDKVNYGTANSTDHYEVRVIEDDREVFGLAGLEEENVYEETHDGLFMMLSDDADLWPGRLGYLYQLADGSFFIIDGGTDRVNSGGGLPAQTLMNVLTEHAPDPDNIVIAGWLFTHIHEDHVGAFWDISTNASWVEKLNIEKIIYNMPNEDEMAIQDKYHWQDGSATSATGGVTARGKQFDAAVETFNPDQIIKAHSGQQFFLRDLTLTIDVAQDTILYSNDVTTRNSLVESINWHNSTSVVSRVDYKGKTAIYLGDTHQISVRNTITPLFRSIYGECEIVQVAHHGYDDTAADILYKYLDVEMVLWPVYRQHLQGLYPDGSYYPNKESQYGGVIYYDFNKNITKDGIKQITTIKNLCVVCDDFDTWEFYEKDYVPN